MSDLCKNMSDEKKTEKLKADKINTVQWFFVFCMIREE